MVDMLGGPLPTCWVLERKHRMIKRHANPMTNTAGRWDKTVLRSVTVEHVHRLKAHDEADAPWLGPRLIGCKAPPRQLELKLSECLGRSDWVCARQAHAARCKITVGDYVVFNCGQQQEHAALEHIVSAAGDSCGLCLIRVLKKAPAKVPADATFGMFDAPQEGDCLMAVPLEDVVGPSTWMKKAGSLLILEQW